MDARMLLGGKKMIRVLAAGSLVAAGGFMASGRPVHAGSPVTVTVWSWRSQDAPMWQQVQKALQAKGENIRINFTSKVATQYDAVLQTAMTGGAGPDVFYGRAGAGTAKYAAAHLIAPLNGKVDLSTVNSATLGAGEYQGKDYGVPFATQTLAIFYNKAIFQQYHLSVPTTWAQLLSDCATLKSHGVTPFYVMGIQQWMLALSIDAVGASTVSGAWAAAVTSKKTNFNSAPYIHTLTKFQQLSQYFEHNFLAVGSAGNEQEEALGLGRAAMIFDGIWAVPSILQYNKSLQLGDFLVPPESPTPQPQQWYTRQAQQEWYVDGDMALNAHISNAAEAAAALKVVQFTATPAFGQLFSDIAGEISPIKGVTLPSQYPLSIQAYNQFQHNAISPIYAIRSPMDTPPTAPVTAKTSTVSGSQAGIFTAEQAIVDPLISNKLTPAQAAGKVQSNLSWYFSAKH
ncbi:MAG TPA: extracellular solute-binding protein [Chloroflexota bacterium]|nr:extracellular solute-binding protein [Chloroflexota bacterium]